MFSRITQLLMVLLMAAPTCWCMMAQAMPKTEECPSCHKFLLPEDQPQRSSAPASDCACCQGMLERSSSPDSAAAPRLVLVDLQTWVWQPVLTEVISRTTSGLRHTLADNALLRRSVPPIYQRHCALLI